MARSIDNTAPIGRQSEYLASRSSSEEEIPGYRRDSSWVRLSFIAPYITGSGTEQLAMAPEDIRNMSFSTANFKSEDTRPGGAQCINPLPSLTRYADIRVEGLNPGSKKQITVPADGVPVSLGRYYSEAFDDHNQVIHLRFGVASYNSLTQFFTGFYNSSASSLARTGRFEMSFVEKFLKFASHVISLAIMPLAIIPILFIFAGQAVRFLMKIPSSKFCYLKPSMPAYWNAVSTMYNQLATNMGFNKWTQPEITEQFIGSEYVFKDDDFNIFKQIFPNFTDKGVLDVAAVASRHKRREMVHRKVLLQQLASQGEDGWYGKVRAVYDNNGAGLQKGDATETTPRSMTSLWDRWNASSKLSKTAPDKKQDAMVLEDLRQFPDVAGMSVAEAEKTLKGGWKGEEDKSTWNYFEAAADDGMDYASFRVDYSGNVQESFSNQSESNSLAEKLNSSSSSARDLSINLAGGNIDPWGVTQAVLSGVGTILSTAADILQVSGLAAFAGNAFVDIPDHWKSHSASLPSTNYTISLVSPYNNKISQMMNIYLPLCMLLAGCLPLATGKQSYTSPFLCELYDRGRCITRFGMIESLSITRGTGHTAWTHHGVSLGIDVSFKIKDLSSIVAMPIAQGISLFPLEGIFDGDTAYTDMLMAWSGLSLGEVNNRIPLLKRQIDNKIANYSSYFSASRLLMDLGASPVGVVASIFMAGTPKK